MFSRIFLLAILTGAAPLASAADVVTKPEAEAMVKKAITYLKANGREKTFAEIDKKDGQFVDRDLYLTVYGTDGVVRAHGANAKMIGKNLMELKDVDGKAFVKERVEMAKKKYRSGRITSSTIPSAARSNPKPCTASRKKT